MSVRIGPTQRTVKSLFKVRDPVLCMSVKIFSALVGAPVRNL